ncbi:MAG: hypothetical protein HC857_06990 [Synechococcales cyanobacterium RU_4_20]|nr:hypothetical protein [Synechococcales cyanobacterium RU_4_20]
MPLTHLQTQAQLTVLPNVLPNVLPDTQPSLIAHQTQIDGAVGGTHHIEPNDLPRAGELATAWFALVQADGDAISLGDCNCTVALYGSPYRSGDAAIASPSLKAISIEGQTDVPAIDIIFPQLGAYELVIRGQPRETATFSPFELRFPVTVAAGQAAPVAVEPTETSQTRTNQAETNQTGTNQTYPSLASRGGWAIGLGAIALVGIALMAIAHLTRKR